MRRNFLHYLAAFLSTAAIGICGTLLASQLAMRNLNLLAFLTFCITLILSFAVAIRASSAH